MTAPAHTPAQANAWFWRYWAGSTISDLGDAVTDVALPLTAIEVVHATNLQVGLIAAAGYAAWAVITLPAGVIVSRLPLRATQVAMDLIRAAAILTIPLAAWAGALTVVQLIVVALIVGFASVVFTVGNSTLLPTIVSKEQLTARNSLVSGSSAITQLAGPSLGGVLVQIVSAAGSLLVDVASYIASAALMYGLPRPTRLGRASADESIQHSTLHSMRLLIGVAMRFTIRHPVLRVILLASSAVNFVFGMLMTLTPIYLVRVLDLRPALVGVMFASGGAGSLVGAALTPRLIRRIGSAGSMRWTLAVLPPACALMPLATPGWTAVLFALGNAGFGGLVMFSSIIVRTYRQTEVPVELLPRVAATLRFFSWGVTPFGAALAGAAATWLGPRDALWLAIGVSALCPLTVWLSPISGCRDLTDCPTTD